MEASDVCRRTVLAACSEFKALRLCCPDYPLGAHVRMHGPTDISVERAPEGGRSGGPPEVTRRGVMSCFRPRPLAITILT